LNTANGRKTQETQVHWNQRHEIERQDDQEIDRRERRQRVPQSADDGVPVPAVIVLDRRPDPEQVFGREDQDREKLEGMEPRQVRGVEPGFRLDHHGSHVRRDQYDQTGADQPCDGIVLAGRIEDLVNATPQSRHPGVLELCRAMLAQNKISRSTAPLAASGAWRSMVPIAVAEHLDLFERDQAAAHQRLDRLEKAPDSRFRFDDLDHHGEVLREAEDLGGVQPARATEPHRAAQHRGPSQVHLAGLYHDRLV
jgi:hypothetical protein